VVDPTSPPPDESLDAALRALMVRYQRGELEAFEELYRRTLPMLRGYLGALTRDPSRVSDLAQDCYLQLHRSRATYDPRFPVKPWILGIARHVRLMQQRTWRRKPSREVTGLEGVAEVPVLPEAEGLADRQALGLALARIAPARREAIVLHHVYGMSYREIGQVTGVSELGARVRASRGMADLRRALEGMRP
jgi:RNA polymerase sigma-70 factor (ECF subfamily)